MRLKPRLSHAIGAATLDIEDATSKAAVSSAAVSLSTAVSPSARLCPSRPPPPPSSPSPTPFLPPAQYCSAAVAFFVGTRVR
eukprot:6188585-Pleurochrysis_carterae.AAC.6